jgi:hypothetical protein
MREACGSSEAVKSYPFSLRDGGVKMDGWTPAGSYLEYSGVFWTCLLSCCTW